MGPILDEVYWCGGDPKRVPQNEYAWLPVCLQGRCRVDSERDRWWARGDSLKMTELGIDRQVESQGVMVTETSFLVERRVRDE